MAASASQQPQKIPDMWQCISIIIPLGKQVHPCKLYACLPLLFTSLSVGHTSVTIGYGGLRQVVATERKKVVQAVFLVTL